MENFVVGVGNKPALLKAEEVAARLGISTAFAYRLMQRGEVPTVRLGRLVRVRENDLEAYIESQVQSFSYERDR